MKVGDLVKKVDGDLDVGEVGIILEIVENSLGNTIVTVNSGNTIKKWYDKLLHVVSK